MLSPQPAGDVNDYAYEIQALDVFCHHGFAGQVFGIDAAEGDFGSAVTFGAVGL